MIFWLVFAGFVQHLLHRLDLDPTIGEVSILWQKIEICTLAIPFIQSWYHFPTKIRNKLDQDDFSRPPLASAK